MEYLLEWKRLFEAISSDVKVYLNNLDGQNREFEERFESVFRSDVSGVYVSDHVILVVLEGVKYSEDLRFLVGDSGDCMFSNWEVSQEAQLQWQEEAIQDFIPKTKSWKYWYDYLCDEYERLNNSIPKPPEK